MKRKAYATLCSFKIDKIKAFTLVELLIVMAVLAILSSLLVPSLRKVLDTAPTFACLNQQKYIGQAFAAYCEDYSGYYPSGNVTTPTPQPQSSLAIYFGGQPNSGDLGRTILRRYVSAEMASAERLTAEIWFCPLDVISGRSDRGEVGVSFQMNGYTGASLASQTIFYTHSGTVVTPGSRKVQDVLLRTMLMGCNATGTDSENRYATWGTEPRNLMTRWRKAVGLESSTYGDRFIASYHRDLTCNFLFSDLSAQNMDPRETVDYNLNPLPSDGYKYPFWAINK